MNSSTNRYFVKLSLDLREMTDLSLIITLRDQLKYQINALLWFKTLNKYEHKIIMTQFKELLPLYETIPKYRLPKRLKKIDLK